jgi:hypothetical protein
MQCDIKGIYPKMEHYKKFSSRSLRRKSNRCIHTRVAARRPSQKDGRIKPKIVSDLVDIANRFIDGEEDMLNGPCHIHSAFVDGK